MSEFQDLAWRLGSFRDGKSTPWYLASGVTPLAAYRAKGATSYAASLVNLVTPGTYDLVEGNGTVPWDATNGWKFILANSQYFDTGIIPANNQQWSILIQFSGLVLAGTFRAFAGTNPSAGRAFGLVKTNDTPVLGFYSGNALTFTVAGKTSGNVAVSGNLAFIDGVQQAGTIGVLAAVFSNIFIGAWKNTAGIAAAFITSNITAAIIHSATYTPAQINTQAIAMAAL